ncbi:MAG: sensor histidine kinase, partial [Armatimonadota bacterium]
AAVDGFLSVLSEGLVKDPEQEKHMLQRCRERIRALAELVSDLLDMARMEAGRVRREIMPQKLSDIISVVVELMAPVAQQHGVTLTTQVPDDLRSVDADREELIRLFNNLVSNAIKYNRPGGTVTITAAEDGAYVKVAVADTGVGISEEGLKRLFTEFFREKRPETREISGTGLGLSIVKRIVDFYHGRLDVQSKIGEGSTFTVWLPFSTSVPSSVSAATGESREGQ